LLASFAALLALMLFMGALAYVEFRKMSDYASSASTDSIPSLFGGIQLYDNLLSNHALLAESIGQSDILLRALATSP
jgi:hypothetical protein